MISSIVLADREERGVQRARVTLQSGEGNAGMLIFADGRNRPEYVRWTDLEQ